MEDNEALNSWAGIRVADSYWPTITGNHLHHNTVGLNFSSGSCHVDSTLIEENATGIIVDGGVLFMAGDGDLTGISENDRIQNNTGNGIQMHDDAYMTVYDYSISDNLGHGVYDPSDSTDNRSSVAGCDVNNNGGNGIDISCETFTSFVVWCEITHNGGHGIHVSNRSNIPYVVIGYNTIHSNILDGIYLDSIGAPTGPNGPPEISDCNISYNGGDGIEINNSDARVYRNGIHNNNNRGVYVTGNSVLNLGDFFCGSKDSLETLKKFEYEFIIKDIQGC